MADACAVEVHLTGLETPSGRAVARLFAEGDDLFRPARPEVAVPVVGSEASIALGTVPCGRWAVIVYHDVNDNATLDHRWGLPAEPLAFSGGFALGWFSGMPRFDKLAFEVTGPTVVDLVLR